MLEVVLSRVKPLCQLSLLLLKDLGNCQQTVSLVLVDADLGILLAQLPDVGTDHLTLEHVETFVRRQPDPTTVQGERLREIWIVLLYTCESL